MTVPQTKEISGTNAEAKIEGGLWVGILGCVLGAIAVGSNITQPREIDLRFQLQQQQLEQRNREQTRAIEQLTEKVKQLTTDVMLYREDVIALEKKR